MWTTSSTSRQRFSSQSNMSLGRHEVADRMLGDVAPLAEFRLVQAVADHDVEVAVLGQLGHDVGADEAGPAGDEGDASRVMPAPSSAMRAMAAVVE